MKTTMRAKACQIVSNYVVEHIDKTDKVPVFQVYILSGSAKLSKTGSSSSALIFPTVCTMK